MSMCRLTGGFYSPSGSGPQKFDICNPHFVLFHDLLKKQNGFLCGDIDMLRIICAVRVLTNDVQYVDRWLFQPLELIFSHNTERTLVNDLK